MNLAYRTPQRYSHIELQEQMALKAFFAISLFEEFVSNAFPCTAYSGL